MATLATQGEEWTIDKIRWACQKHDLESES